MTLCVLFPISDHSRSYNQENISTADISDITPSAVTDDSNFPTEIDSIMSDDRPPSITDSYDVADVILTSLKRKYEEGDDDEHLEKIEPE
jgi:hypothetical protein